MNILKEFEKRYKNDPSQADEICKIIAEKFKLDEEAVIDYVHIYRYEDNPPEFMRWASTYVPALDE